MSQIFENQREEIKNFFNNINELKKYIEEHRIDLKALNDDEYDVLIDAIENSTSLEVIKYLIEKIDYKTFNYTIEKINYKTFNYSIKKTTHFPLYTAIAYNKYEISNYLLKNEADINFNNGSLLSDLLKSKKLTTKNLKYILDNGYNVNNINTYLIKKLLKKNVNSFMYILKRYIFDNNFILLLLNYYKNKIPLRDKDIKKIFYTEKNKLFVINEDMYSKALNLSKGYDVIKFLFDYDDFDKLNYRIYNLNLLEMAIQNNDINFIKKILNFSMYNSYSSRIKYIISLIDNNNCNKTINEKTIKYIMKSALEMVAMTNNDNVIQKGGKKERKMKKKLENKNKNILLYDASYLNDIIIMAIQLKSINLIKYFLENKRYRHSLNLNSKSIKGEYPIFIAIQQDDFIIFKYLIDKGADYKIKDNDGNSVLVKALTTTLNSSIFYYLMKLLDGEIDINKKDKKTGNTLLFNAIGTGDKNINYVISIVNYGIHHSMDKTIKNINGDTPLTLSYKLGHQEILKVLLNYFDVNEKDNQGYPPLYYAVNNNDEKMTKLLLDMGAKPNITDNYGNTLLHLAIYNRDINIIQILLENKKVNVNDVNQLGESPLITLTKKPFSDKINVKFIKKMIDRGCDINLTNTLGNSALFYISQNDISCELIPWLIENGANINIKNNNGYTSLDYALKSKKYFKALDLCKFGCKVGHKDSINFSLLSNLIKVGGKLNLIQYLYSQVKFNVNEFDRKSGKTLLQYAIENNDYDIISFFKETDPFSNAIKKDNINENGKKIHEMDSSNKKLQTKRRRN